MYLYKTKHLLYAVLFLLPGILSVFRGESIAAVTSILMSAVFMLIHFVTRSNEGEGNAKLLTGN